MVARVSDNSRLSVDCLDSHIELENTIKMVQVMPSLGQHSANVFNSNTYMKTLVLHTQTVLLKLFFAMTFLPLT